MIKKEDLYFERGIVLTFVGITWEQVSEILGDDLKGTPEEDEILTSAIQKAYGVDADPVDGFTDEDCWYLVYRNYDLPF